MTTIYVLMHSPESPKLPYTQNLAKVDPFSYVADDIVSWLKWGYYISPLMYGQNAIAVNEFLDERWNGVSSTNLILSIAFAYID